ncbi:hypothetical protein FNV43_RR02667 [Rhamnella rubrinervis]|uniref:Disease resistance R13L4/SHOC-2-like LRR domain-containing protein n=1 Tax=Rhamnella rubrinervis TaxID=2594499 RepID=A0A8K0HSI7_9ROSA|nr:hypothetical protein FNV43_RR02667 [Rhamnella rubrinervis]
MGWSYMQHQNKQRSSPGLVNSWLRGPLRSNSSLFKLHALRRINLSYNNFSFSIIPSEFDQLSRLTYLNLSFSMFYGRIPSELSFLNHLVSLSLSSFLNYDETSLLHLGKVDFANLIQNMTNLRHLRLHQVNISSSIPKSLANLSSLTSLILGGCSLHGKFPDKVFQKLPNSIGNLNSLSRLSLYGCNFVGPLPSSFWNLSQLTHLDLSCTHFTGLVLPSTLGNLAKLTVLLLDSSQFSGALPSSIGNLTRLEILFLNNNSFSGQIQNSLGNLTKLETISISSNNFNGQIPASLGNLNDLKILDLADNNLDGVIPSSLFTVPSLNVLLLASNQFTGPLIIQNISSSQLEILDLGENKLDGRIPRWLGSSLQILNLQGNNFNESIPHELFTYGSMHNKMRVVDLSHNQFQGRVPQSLINCSKLQILNLGHNQINLSFNNFNGSLPSEYFRNWGYMSKAPDGNELNMTYFSKYKEVPNQSYAYKYSVSMMNKGSEMELWKALTLFKSIDLSNNRFDGEIQVA